MQIRDMTIVADAKLTQYTKSQLFPESETKHDNNNRKVSWSDFTQTTTFHGIRYIFSENHLRTRK